MPKTEAERKVVSGWSKELEQVEMEKLTAAFRESTDVLAKFARAMSDTRESFVAYSMAIKEADFDAGSELTRNPC